MTTNMELVTANPAELIIDTNVRTVVDIDPLFYESIRDHGVRQPPTGWRDEDGRIHIELGQRRVLASVKAEHAEIPVIVKPRDVAVGEREAEQQRIVDQLSENDHRAGLTEAEHVAAWQQLTLFGMTADQIAKATKTKREVVRAAVKLVQESPRTVQVMQEQQLPLDVAAQLVEFQDDEALHQSLAETAVRDAGQFAAAVRSAQKQRSAEEQIAAIRAEVEADGFEFVHPTVTRDAVTGEFEDFGYWLVHRQTGEKLTEELAKDLGLLVVSAIESGVWESGAWVTRWIRHPFARGAGEHGYINQHRQSGRGPLTDAQKQERREKRERRAAWKIATEVRHEWIRANLLQQTKMPDGALLWIVKALLHQRDAYHSGLNAYDTNYLEFAETMLGITHETDSGKERKALLAAIESGKGQAELRVGLAAAIGCMEYEISNPKHPRFGEDTTAGAYLTQLETWGYQLTEAERALVKLAKKRKR